MFLPEGGWMSWLTVYWWQVLAGVDFQQVDHATLKKGRWNWRLHSLPQVTQVAQEESSLSFESLVQFPEVGLIQKFFFQPVPKRWA
jgi:hypothetical protein